MSKILTWEHDIATTRFTSKDQLRCPTCDTHTQLSRCLTADPRACLIPVHHRGIAVRASQCIRSRSPVMIPSDYSNDLVLKNRVKETTWEVAAFSQYLLQLVVGMYSLLPERWPPRVQTWSHGPCSVLEVSQSTWSTLNFYILEISCPNILPQNKKKAHERGNTSPQNYSKNPKKWVVCL